MVTDSSTAARHQCALLAGHAAWRGQVHLLAAGRKCANSPAPSLRVYYIPPSRNPGQHLPSSINGKRPQHNLRRLVAATVEEVQVTGHDTAWVQAPTAASGRAAAGRCSHPPHAALARKPRSPHTPLPAPLKCGGCLSAVPLAAASAGALYWPATWDSALARRARSFFLAS